jgi:hypothetical protein
MEAPINDFDINIIAEPTTIGTDRLVSCLWSLYPERASTSATDTRATMPRAQAGQKQFTEMTEL